MKKSSSVLVEAKNTELKSFQMHHRLEQPEAGEVPKTFSELAYDGQLMATELKLEQVDNEIYEMPFANAVEWSKKMKIEENIEKPKEQNKTTKALKEDAKMYKFENELNPFKKLFEWNIFANIVKSAKELHHKDENEEKVMVADEDEGAHHISKLSFEEVNSNPKNVHEPEEITKHEIPDLEDSIDMEEPKEFQNWVEFEKKQAEKYHEEDVKIGMDEVTMSADVVNWEKENEKGHEEARNDTVMGEGTEKKLTEDDKDGLVQDEEDCEKSMREDGKINGGDQLKEVKDIEKSLEDNILMNETEERGERVYEKVESERIILEMQQSTEDEKNLDAMQQAFGYNGISFEVVDVYDQHETEDVVRTHDAVGHERNLEGTEVTSGLMTMEEHEKEKDRSESYSLAVDQEDEMEEKESDDCTGLAQVLTGLQGINDQVDTCEILVIDKSGEYLGQIESNFEQKEKEDHMTGYTGVCSQEKDFTEMPCELDENCVDSEESDSDIVSNCEENEKNFIPIHSNIWLGNRIATENAFGTENCSQEVPCELGETHDDLNKSEDENCVDSEESDIVSNCEENEKNFMPIDSNIWLGNRIATENAFGTENCSQEVPCELGETHEEVNKSELSASNKTDDTYFESSPDRRQANAHIDAETSQKPCPLEQRETITEISEEKKTNESSCEEGDDHDQMLTREEKEAEDNFEKEVKMEKESPKQKEAKNRDMEKEKERIVVERAIREARERAFAEAKERAERAAAEKAAAAAATKAQKRVTSEARDRLENPSTQTNHKSTAEKASLEAKLKAERVAVERATAEARERALEKAMSEKARNKSDRSTTDKFSGASRDDGATSEDQQKKGQVPSSSSYPSRGANDELDQRCKDTLERNQRTADRTAKALSEKNMRDLLVQKEQAERNRLAETLDAEVKRWSSGKERNLRALLSTLQYILGPDSGWKPIPLTDLVPTAAVKKAYRKATLFVHPDKLQQRGASIQQKYTCEKVFDLLKEAWNKFNSEEL
ncbi:hypothetical protein K2173_027833 [Erythroxylum novogranatense]|uniref:J domain-containing protein n=1 Tax=Erythroxylum novogranatense TaxID=1862640 RepID=A0AAV8U074_9ROSI|nr:hypothetical protein K2173_027833 [Erythroxylum novogranatense]